MEDAIAKAGVLLEALGWIRRFRGRFVVVKLGGSALDDEHGVRNVLTDVLFMETVGMKPIVVHGGGKAISRAMQAAGVEPRFVLGRRYTDETTLQIVSRVLREELAPRIAGELERLGGLATALVEDDRIALVGEPLEIRDSDGRPIDLGHVGQVSDIRRELIAEAFARQHIPVIPSVARTNDGAWLNVNADTAAAAVARLIQAEKLVFLSDVPGILANRDDPQSLISHVDADACRELIAAGVIESGMVPKVEAGLEALAAGVGKVHIVDARLPHSLLLEIYSDRGIGTEIVHPQRSSTTPL